MIEIERFKAGKYIQNGEYRCFVPSFVDREWGWKDAEINLLLEKTAHQLGELKAFSRQTPNIGLFINLWSESEAVSSSRIEGTQTDLDEALKPELEINPGRRDDWQEVRNYITALKEAEDSALPVSSRLIKTAHKALMQGVRGQNKAPGEYRKTQNWLEKTPVSAKFIPPPALHVDALMGDLEKFLHNDKLPALIRIAVAHYQFETIHPFLDGNGRIGRLIIPLYLAGKGAIGSPLLYMSHYLEKHKLPYYECLTRVREENDMAGWLKFFMRGVEQSAKNAARALIKTQALKEKTTGEIHKIFKRSGKPLMLLDLLFRQPIINAEEAAQACGITYAAGRRLAVKMTKAKILRETAGRTRRRLFVFDSYLDIFRG